MIQPGTILAGRYEIIKQIGSGGMALVYQARCHKLNRYVAIKVLRQEFNEDEDFLKRFLAEAQATAGLVHPNIVTIYDAGEEQGCHYIVMELCEGTTLKRYIRRYGRLSVRETVDFAKQIARGIQAAHNRGIVHRDIKPQNILVSESGRIKVTDFGIAKAANGDTNTPNAMGSVHYLSPEQARGRYADARSDIYSLGITMYEMATGRVPFDGENSVTIALMHLQDEITPPTCYFPDIPVSLEKIILKCTMKHTAERYQNAQELLDDLEKVFSCPDGEYVFMTPDTDANPTIHRTKTEIDQINQLGESMEKQREEKEIFKYPKEDPEEEEWEEEDDSMQPQMKRMIMVITVAAGIMLAFIVIYLVVSSAGRLHFPGFGKGEATTTEASPTTTQEATTQAETVVMPNVLKRTAEEAKKLLEEKGLEARFEYDATADMNQKDNFVVLEQQYKEGENIEKGTLVTLTMGPDPEATTEEKRVEVPLLINETKESAEKLLEEAGLKAKFIYATSDTVKQGYIIKQNPTAGTEVDRGFAITLTVSKGVSQVKVPPLTGLSQDAAKKLLNDIGLELGEVTSDYSGSVGVGEVFRQGIASGTLVDKGTSVSVVISIGEHTSFHYEGQITIEETPFAEEETGTVKLVLKQNGQEKTIYSQSGMSSSDFPFHYTFTGKEEGTAVVVMYINGNEYQQYDVDIRAVED